MPRKANRSLLLLGAIVAAVVLAAAGSAAAPAGPPERQAVAQHILKVQGKFLTSPAQAALRMVANNDRTPSLPARSTSA